MLQSPPDGIMLVARLVPTGASWLLLLCYSLAGQLPILLFEHCADLSELQHGKSSLIVGVAVMSFNTATREQTPTLQPPDHAAYLSNIAVDSQYRR